MTNKKRPAGRGGKRGRRTTTSRYTPTTDVSSPTRGARGRNSPDAKPQPEPIGDAMWRAVQPFVYDLIDQSIAVERQYVVAGWFDPEAMIEAAANHAVCGQRFADPICGFLFAYVATCADRGIDPGVDHCIGLAHHEGVDLLNAVELRDLLVTTDYAASEVDDYAAGVAMFAERRDEAAAASKKAGALICGDEFVVTITPRNRASKPVNRPRGLHIPSRLTRSRRCHARPRVVV